jgi:putative aldouronate transport system permease protein
MYGLVIAFQDYNPFVGGITGSDWVGLKHFIELFQSNKFFHVFRNTLLISLYKILFRMPAPLILALLLNELWSPRYKKIVQTISYLPHFLSWVVIAGLFKDILSPNDGAINRFLGLFGVEPISFLGENRFFRSILVFTDIWRDSGWGAIVYLAAIAGINPELYEAAIIDGAKKWDQIWHITLPCISSTIAIVLILKMGAIMNVGTEHILMFYNEAVYDTGDVIGTYVYRVGIGQLEFSFTSAVGMFNSVIGLVMIVTANYFSKKYSETSVW